MGMWWLSSRDVVAQNRCVDSIENVVSQLRSGGSREMWWLKRYRDALDLLDVVA